MVKKWIGEGKCIVMYLDDGIGFGQDFESARSISESVRADLQSSGFVINASKSLWNPIQSLSWLGYSIDTVKFVLTIPARRLKKVGELVKRSYQS